MANDLEAKLEEIEAKIQREISVVQGFKAMMCAHSKRDLRSQCEDGIRQSETILAFFRSEKEKLKELLTKQETLEMKALENKLEEAFPSFSKGSTDSSFRPRPTALDFRKHNPPLSREMVAFRVQEIQHKLLVEEKVLEAVNKYKSTAATEHGITSKESQQQANLKWFDSSEKARIYSLALRELKPLVLETVESPDIEPGVLPSNAGVRQPISGTLIIKLLAEQNLAYSEDCEISVILQIDGTTRGQPFKIAAGDRRVDHFREEVTRANEMELLVVAQGRERGGLIGLLWIPLNEIVDELRRRAQGNTGWYPAEPNGRLQSTEVNKSPEIEDWFKLEPAGKLLLRLSFDKDTGSKNARLGLGRQGAFRKGKRLVVATYMGHKFEHRQVYRLLTCPVCRKFAINSIEFQCQDCNFFCHTTCAKLVRAKCITSMGQMKRRSLNQIYNIPHRFEGSVGLSAHWCCHCGKLLTFSGGSGRRCIDCDLSCHVDCQHLVPNFCGMTQDMADQLLGFDQPQPSTPPSFTVTSVPPHSPKSPLRTPMVPPVILVPPEEPVSIKSAPNSPSLVQGKAPVKAPSLKDFKLLAVLGRGNFGKVLLAETQATSKVVAIKILKKDIALQNEEVEALQNEKKVFVLASKASHPFLVRMHACFQTPSSVIFVMDYIIGGDLMSLIQRRRSFQPEQARFYCVEIVLALEFLHSQNIVYRDLKLDNVLLDKTGHIKVADYGLCKLGMGYGATTTTFCGTPEFMAPEILEDQKYGRAVDWWALGVLLYQMILGQSPFTGASDVEIFESILEDEVLFRPSLPRATVSLMQRLLTRDPKLRIGGGPGDAKEIKAHDYFKDVNWVAYANCEIRPPYIPQIIDPFDTTNFDEEFTAQPPNITPANSLLTAKEQDQFKDFSFVAE